MIGPLSSVVGRDMARRWVGRGDALKSKVWSEFEESAGSMSRLVIGVTCSVGSLPVLWPKLSRGVPQPGSIQEVA